MGVAGPGWRRGVRGGDEGLELGSGPNPSCARRGWASWPSLGGGGGVIVALRGPHPHPPAPSHTSPAGVVWSSSGVVVGVPGQSGKGC